MPSSRRSGSISPDLTRVPTPTANDFPTPAGQMFTVTKRDQGLVSPAQSCFSFPDEEPLLHTVATSPDVIEEKSIFRHTDRGAPGDGALLSMANGTPQQTELQKKKSQFYSDVFAYREPNLSPREKIYKETIIMAEVKTNVIIKDEYDFLQDFSQHLSQRYQRPPSSIFITLDHSACLLYAGTFESAYSMTISALPNQVLPTTNKRNAALIQIFMAESLSVPATRGVIRFIGVPDEYLATNGTTVLGQIENLQKASGEENGVSPVMNRLRAKHSRNQLQLKPRDLPLREGSQSSWTPIDKIPSPVLKSPPIPAMPAEKSPLDRKAEKVQRLGKRRSFLAMFGK